MFEERGISFAIRTLVGLIIIVLVLFSILALVTDVWEPEIFGDVLDIIID